MQGYFLPVFACGYLLSAVRHIALACLLHDHSGCVIIESWAFCFLSHDMQVLIIPASRGLLFARILFCLTARRFNPCLELASVDVSCYSCPRRSILSSIFLNRHNSWFFLKYVTHSGLRLISIRLIQRVITVVILAQICRSDCAKRLCAQ